MYSAVCLVINSFRTHYYPSVFANPAWDGIGVFAIYINLSSSYSGNHAA
jgi:hypothetical protein